MFASSMISVEHMTCELTLLFKKCELVYNLVDYSTYHKWTHLGWLASLLPFERASVKSYQLPPNFLNGVRAGFASMMKCEGLLD